jgi:peroxiredoxin 6
LGRAAKLAPEFHKRGFKMIAISCNDCSMHKEWIKDIQDYSKLDKSSAFPYPIIDDTDRSLAVRLGMIDPDEKDSTGMPLTARAVSLKLVLFSKK